MSKFTWKSGSYGLGSSGLGLAATGLAMTGFGAPLAATVALGSGILGIFGKEKEEKEKKDILEDQRKTVEHERNAAMNQTFIQTKKADAVARDAYRSGEYDIGRKLKARVESAAVDRREAISTGARNALNNIDQDEKNVKGAGLLDYGKAVANVAFTGFTAASNAAGGTAKVLEAAKETGTIEKGIESIKWYDKLKLFGNKDVKELGKISGAVTGTGYKNAIDYTALINKFQKTKETYKNMATAVQIGKYGLNTQEPEYGY